MEPVTFRLPKHPLHLLIVSSLQSENYYLLEIYANDYYVKKLN